MKLHNLCKLFRIKQRSTIAVTTTDLPSFTSAAAARQATDHHKARIATELQAQERAAQQKIIDQWDETFKFFIAKGAQAGKIGAIIERMHLPPLPQSLIDKYTAEGFHICVDDKEYGYTDIVIINWELKRPNFYDQNWDNYWKQIGTEVPPASSF